MKLLVFGLDALSWNYIRRDNSMPALMQLANTGWRGDMLPEIPRTWESWTTIFTGLSYKRHGVGGPQASAPVGLHRGKIQARAYLWDALEKAGLSYGLYCFPCISEPPWTSPDGSWNLGCVSHLLVDPDSPHRKLTKTLPICDTKPGPVQIKKKTEEAYAAILAVCDAEREDLKQQLLTRELPDVLMFYTHTPDSAGHWFGEWQPEKVAHVYGLWDDTLKALIGSCNPENVVVLSDHGMRSQEVVGPGRVKTHKGSRMATALRGDLCGLWLSPAGEQWAILSGQHASDAPGVWVASGIAFRKGQGPITNLDIMPTLLAAVGADPMVALHDGVVRRDMLRTPEPCYTPEEEQEMEEHLRSLGYVE